MTTFLLVRHCAVDALGQYLAGRSANEHLNSVGLTQARRIGERFAGFTLDAVYSSPLERACETASALEACTGAPARLADELLELDFGEWTRKTFDQLSQDPRWPLFHTNRATTRIPGGELVLDVQHRVVAFLGRVSAELPSGRVAVVSHSDVIRAAICFCLGMPLDFMQRFEIAPASVSVLDFSTAGTFLRCMNVVDFDPQTQMPG